MSTDTNEFDWSQVQNCPRTQIHSIGGQLALVNNNGFFKTSFGRWLQADFNGPIQKFKNVNPKFTYVSSNFKLNCEPGRLISDQTLMMRFGNFPGACMHMAKSNSHTNYSAEVIDQLPSHPFSIYHINTKSFSLWELFRFNRCHYSCMIHVTAGRIPLIVGTLIHCRWLFESIQARFV